MNSTKVLKNAIATIRGFLSFGWDPTIAARIFVLVGLMLSLPACNTKPTDSSQVRRIKIESVAPAEVDRVHRGTRIKGRGMGAYPGAAVEIWVERRKLSIDHLVESKPFQEQIGGAVKADALGMFEFDLFEPCLGGIEEAVDYKLFAKDRSARTESVRFAIDKDPLECP